MTQSIRILSRCILLAALVLGPCRLTYEQTADATDPRYLLVNASFKSLKVADALKLLFSRTKFPYQYNASVLGTVTVDLKDCPFTRALDTTLAASTGSQVLTYDVVDGVYHIQPEKSVDYKKMAYAAGSDLLANFWNGNAFDGNVKDPADWSSADPNPTARGWLWARGDFIVTLENLYEVNHDHRVRAYLETDWAYLQSVFSSDELDSVGAHGQSTAIDDAGWTCMMYLAFYKALNDPSALAHAKRLFTNSLNRWGDTKWGGGLSYNDERSFTNSYQAALILVGLRLSEITKDQTYYDHAMHLYTWMEKTMLRPDGLYWWTIDGTGPLKFGIRQARSDSFLGGNMAMGIIDAYLYRKTGQRIYLDRALRTANAIMSYETDGQGHYLDDRDAWANGLFMGDWARDVLTLPGIGVEHRRLLQRSALGAFEHARTHDRYYSACWNGPAEGDGCVWMTTDGHGSNSIKSPPQQLMTSSDTVNVIVAAAELDGN